LVAALTAGSTAGEDGGSSTPAAAAPAKTAATKADDTPKPAAKTTSSTKSKEPRATAPEKTASRVALAEKGAATGASGKAASTRNPEAPIDRALRIVGECQERYQSVNDYTCTFFKRERISGKLIPAHIMSMKVRTKPHSIYLKFQQPAQGREAIYIAGQHGGKVLAHDVGLNKLLGGTVRLEPTSARAMEDCRHPITEAGIGALLGTVKARWALELNPKDTVVAFEDMLVGEHRCEMIETTHPEKSTRFLFHKVRLFIDKDLGLPIRFEAYDWPKRSGVQPELAEEYTYDNLKLNLGLTDADFDPANTAYSFGRF
jgi:hypothetical protein